MEEEPWMKDRTLVPSSCSNHPPGGSARPAMETPGQTPAGLGLLRQVLISERQGLTPHFRQVEQTRNCDIYEKTGSSLRYLESGLSSDHFQLHQPQTMISMWLMPISSYPGLICHLGLPGQVCTLGINKLTTVNNAFFLRPIFLWICWGFSPRPHCVLRKWTPVLLASFVSKEPTVWGKCRVTIWIQSQSFEAQLCWEWSSSFGSTSCCLLAMWEVGVICLNAILLCRHNDLEEGSEQKPSSDYSRPPVCPHLWLLLRYEDELHLELTALICRQIDVSNWNENLHTI